MHKTAVFCSGGGFLGAYQAGAIQRLHENGIRPSYAYGISVGALNAAKWMMGEVPQLTDMWRRIEFKDIFSGIPWLNVIKSDGMYSNDPLKKLIAREIVPSRMQGEFYCGSCNLNRSEYHVYSNKTHSDHELCLGILESTTIPGQNKTVIKNGEKWVDGGVENVAPIGDFLRLTDRDIDHIYIINCQMSLEPSTNRKLKGIKDVLLATVGMLLEKQVRKDVEYFATVNKLIAAAGVDQLDKFKFIPYTLIEPSKPLGGGMNADREWLNHIFGLGYMDAA